MLSVLGLALYLWPALTAPVVLWSDSRIDMTWAKAGVGLVRPIPAPASEVSIGHLAKPGYLLFLRLAMAALPSLGEARSIVVVQSALLALSILAASLWLARRRGAIFGLALAVCCLVFLRLRDVSSAVMPEALAAALMLPIAALVLDPPRRRRVSALLGLTAGFLFLVRPNCGAALILLAAASLFLARDGKRLLLFFAGFAALALPFWYLGRSNLPGDPLHGLGYQILEGSADYYWTPSVEPWPIASTPGEMAYAELGRATSNWKRTLSQPGPDARRELVWRALHGLFGQEYYDGRWSRFYARASEGSRLVSPLLLLAAITAVSAGSWRGSVRVPKAMGILLLALLLGQNLLLGSNPRYVLPFLPVLFLLGASTLKGLAEASRRRRIVVVAVGLILGALLATQRHVLDWQSGKVESAGVTLRQKIPRNALPRKAPATLHVRIAPPIPASGAHFALVVHDRPLFSSQSDRERAAITVSLPQWLLDENTRGPIEMEIHSMGDYGDYSYLLFPVIPLPWSQPASRDGSPVLSPATGIRAGSLDWWAHQGSP